MKKTGILLHVRHPATLGWEKLVWGVSAENRLGSLPMVVELLLKEPKDEPVGLIVLGTTDASQDGLLEGEYTKRYLLDHFDELARFPRLALYLNAMSPSEREALRRRLEAIVITPIIKNTLEEVVAAAELFTARDIDKIVQVTAASHGPRCLQMQSYARAQGIIRPEQLWSVVVDDMCFEDSDPMTTLIFEVPHRGDDPMVHVQTRAAEVLRPYFKLSPNEKRLFLDQVAAFMASRTKDEG
jgi:hypothetical protein